MTWLQRLGWSLLALATLAIAIVPDMLTLPEPIGAIVINQVTYLPNSGPSRQQTLPHAIYPKTSQHPTFVRYLIHFELPAPIDKDLLLFIPTINRHISLEFNGERLFGGSSHSLWAGPVTSTSIFVQLPRRTVVTGRNELAMLVETGPFVVPTYLSRIYIGTEAELAPSFTLRAFFGDQLKTMAFAAHLLLGVGLAFAFLFRPNDPLFFWFTGFNILSLIAAIGMFVGFQPTFQHIVPYIVILLPASVVFYFGTAMALAKIPIPRALPFIAVALTCILLPLPLIGTMLARQISAASVTTILIVGYGAATGLIAWGAFRRNNADARLILAPSFLLAWYVARDAYVAANLPQHAFNLLVPYARPVLLAAIMILLMRRMGNSLDQLDQANETLNFKLAEREAEISELHREEQAMMAHLIRDKERQRLTYDLHDGISGHLASIVALAEQASAKTIEQAARAALGDLRLVIYSLDVEDRELPLALANLCERLEPQLLQFGVELDWSIAGLPEVSGVTPGNALAILRIIQEAITNAIKHGPASKITMRGAEAAGGMVAITIENDGQEFTETRGGHGLTNMRRRARLLHGGLNIESIEHGVRLTLLLPSKLPSLEEEAAK